MSLLLAGQIGPPSVRIYQKSDEIAPFLPNSSARKKVVAAKYLNNKRESKIDSPHRLTLFFVRCAHFIRKSEILCPIYNT